MISYFRTNKQGLEIASAALFGIEFMIIKSEQTKLLESFFTDDEMIIYDIPAHKRYQSERVPDTTHMIVILTDQYPNVEARFTLSGITVKWVHVPDGIRPQYKEFAYQTGSHIIFRVFGRKPMKFEPGVTI